MTCPVVSRSLRALSVLTLILVPVYAQPVSVKLTTNALGLGTSEFNGGTSVSADVAGKIITSPVTGQGSILTVQRSGVAGPGTPADPLLVTITARTHLDTVSGLPASHDFTAGVIYLSVESSQLPDGADEGLGVRAFTVSNTTGIRTLDASNRARIEGSKEVSGGTGPTAFVPGGSNNGPPHVDEDVLFTFNPALNVKADTVEIVLSKFESTDRIDLEVALASGVTTTLLFEGTANTALFQAISATAKVWKVRIAGVPGVGPLDILRTVRVRAVDDRPSSPSGTAEHFLISGIRGDLVPCPVVLLGDAGPAGSTSYNFTTASPIYFDPGEALRWTIGETPGCPCTGGAILIVANIGVEAISDAVTPGVPGFKRFHNFSIPAGIAGILADGLGIGPLVGFPVGIQAPNFVGDPPWGFITPPTLPPCFPIKAQAVIFCPGSNSFSVTNEILWISTCN
jgi:hypothetical protein